MGVLFMNQEKLKELIEIIKKEAQRGDLILKYGSGGLLTLRKGGVPTITETGWLIVVNNESNHVHYINLETVNEIIITAGVE